MPAHSSTDVPDVITVGRVSVDLYAEEVNASFTDPQTFRKSIGGSPTNVAVSAARHGHHRGHTWHGLTRDLRGRHDPEGDGGCLR